MRSFIKKPIIALLGVALLALLWNGMTYFLVMEQMDPIAAQTLTDEYRHFIAVRPMWALAAANLTYVAGFLGIALLLLSPRSAVWAFGISAITAAATVIPTYLTGPFIIGSWMLLATILAVLFAWFAQRKATS